MPLRQNAIRVGVTPKARESSALRSPRDSGDQSRMWIKLQELSSQVQSLMYAQRRTDEIVRRLRIYKPQPSEGGGNNTTCPPA